MKIVFMGTINFSVYSLIELHKTFGVDLVVTQPDRYVGRKKILTQNVVKKKAIELGIPVFQPKSIKTDFKPVLDIKPDLVVTAAFGQFIPKEIINYPKMKCLNVHGSLLPKYRGGAPIQRSIMNQDDQTGVTIMFMEMKMDSGDILMQESVPITKTTTSGDLFDSLGKLGASLLIKTINGLLNHSINPIKQNEEEVTFAYNLKRDEERIDWTRTASEIDAHVRAFTPHPSVYTMITDTPLKIHSVMISPSDTEKAPGTICKLDKQGIHVQTKSGIIIIRELTPFGKRRMDAWSFINGSGKENINIDTRLV
jgi:methionyl-tRNA formyltransferase